MDDDLIANPQVALEVFLSVRRRGRPMERVKLTDPAALSLVPSLLAGRTASPEEQRRAAIRLGLLLPPHEAAARMQDLRFRGDLDEALLSFLPPHHSDQAAEPPADELELSPLLHIQWGEDLPEAVAARALPGHAVTTGPAGFAAERPVVWVEDPCSGVVTPWWCGGTWGEDLRRVALDGASPGTLSPGAVRALRLAGVLVPRTPAAPGDVGAEREDFDAEPGGERADDVAVLRGTFPPLFVAALRRHFRRMRAEGYFSTDREQVRDGRRDGMYCDAVTLFVQQQLTGAVARWAGSPLRPSYTWAVTYRPGAALERHRDRPQCRWNVSLCVDTDPGDAGPWPFHIRTGTRQHTVELGMGDAVVYSGTDHEHWRDPLPPDRVVTMCLLHYVDPDFTGSLD
ncbi:MULTISPECIES: hypothetical protein [unclassified Streptomyces]|uniref:hypothetical protein n=1 Tax=unclassified Streptomyces TaxID=2593676 RepID=UPI00081E5477|nr:MULTISPECIES: hypothetical protein [unclassified Streptomyces]MYZ39375.1 hypothetical protein [Streptomyces sp. SID4917]SCG03510.1 hypothetical protein GA0115259_108382 [Streptomyces sp. MnatMP-M17]